MKLERSWLVLTSLTTCCCNMMDMNCRFFRWTSSLLPRIR
jgi:hypothetical protein